MGPTFYSDYFYPARSSTYYANRGGTSAGGVECGSFYVRASNGASISAWARGAALSFKQASDSCYSDYFSQNRSGTYYVYRGGGSSTGAGCGTFFVATGRAASFAYWTHSAALSFKPDDDFV